MKIVKKIIIKNYYKQLKSTLSYKSFMNCQLLLIVIESCVVTAVKQKKQNYCKILAKFLGIAITLLLLLFFLLKL